jgi:hypothetical protein
MRRALIAPPKKFARGNKPTVQPSPASRYLQGKHAADAASTKAAEYTEARDAAQLRQTKEAAPLLAGTDRVADGAADSGL